MRSLLAVPANNPRFVAKAAQSAADAVFLLEAMAAAGEEGRGAVKTRDGKMIGLVHIKIARKVIDRAERNPPRRNP